jgi:GNAT superfamily N-acetyltransferase
MIIRKAIAGDRDFIFTLAPTLIENANLSWHSEDIVLQWQSRYIGESLDEIKEPQIVYIAEKDGIQLGFIQIVESKDEISNEPCARVPLIAVTKDAQGVGVGRKLMDEAERWAKSRGHRLLQLEVFYNNRSARGFYEKQGFQNETNIMVKPLEG